MTTRRRDESGAVAVMAAILSLVVLGVGAFAVDLGQVYAKRSSLQSAVDNAAIAAAAELDGTSTCTAKAKIAATTYLRANWINDAQDPMVLDLNDGVETNGKMECTGWRVKLWAPTATVDFGLARAVNNNNRSVEVPAYAAAGVFSPKSAVMPSYAVSGCDYGTQTLLDPPSGPSTPYLPTLLFSVVANSVNLKQGFNSSGLPNGLLPGAIAVNQASSLTILAAGTGGPAGSTAGVNRVAFTTEGGDHVTVAPAPADVTADEVRLAAIPSAVSSVEKVWWVRVSKDGGTTWSAADKALPLRVGSPMLECAGASNSGNFGTIDLPHLRPPASAEKAIEYNIATNVDYGLSILAGGAYCSPGSGGAVAPTADGTNCVKAKTGFAGNPATNGLITGVDASTPGRLDTATTSGCAPDGSSNRFRTAAIRGNRYDINNDTLSCFFLSSSTTVGQVSSPTYAGDPLISEDIFTSPRFFWVPVFGVQPDNGNSNNYAIKGFRPAFVTGEQPASTDVSPVMDPATDNGLVFSSSGIQSLKVVFFNVEALPDTAVGGPTMNYLGTGTKILSLTD